MLFVRRSLYYFFSGLLFLLLIATAWSAALTLTFDSPAKAETWLNQSGFYSHFVDTAIQQVQKNQTRQSSGNTDVSLNDPHVQQAVQAAFTPQIIENAVDTFLNANYAWLTGKTSTPAFSIDFSQAKNAMATNLANYAQSHAASLPKCTPAQLLQMENAGQTFDVLNATCLPTGITPATAAETVKQDALTSQNFLPTPVITPNNVDQATGQDNPSAQPYYVTLKRLPMVYQWATRLPWILGAVSLLCGAVVIALAGKLRKGLRRTASLLIASGVIISALIFVSNLLLHRLENHLFSNSNVGQLQASLTDVLHRAQLALVKVDSWFAISFVAIGLLIFLLLVLTRPKPKGRPVPPRKPVAFESPAPSNPENTPPAVTQPADNTPPKRPKPPTLIQL